MNKYIDIIHIVLLNFITMAVFLQGCKQNELLKQKNAANSSKRVVGASTSNEVPSMPNEYTIDRAATKRYPNSQTEINRLELYHNININLSIGAIVYSNIKWKCPVIIDKNGDSIGPFAIGAEITELKDKVRIVGQEDKIEVSNNGKYYLKVKENKITSVAIELTEIPLGCLVIDGAAITYLPDNSVLSKCTKKHGCRQLIDRSKQWIEMIGDELVTKYDCTEYDNDDVPQLVPANIKQEVDDIIDVLKNTKGRFGGFYMKCSKVNMFISGGADNINVSIGEQ